MREVEGRLVKRLSAFALLLTIAFALACVTVALAPVPRRSVAVTHSPLLHFPLLHKVQKRHLRPVGHPVRSAHGDARPRAKTRRLPAWFVRRRMAAAPELLT